MAKHKDIPGQLPLWEPKSEWKLPTQFPRLDSKTLGFDFESRDPYLTSKGPGFIRGDAEVIGYSLSDGRSSWYFPFNHAYGRQLPRDTCISFLKDLVQDPDRIFIGANTMYEREALWSLGITPRATIYDIQIASPLIDEDKTASLDGLGKRWLGETKNEDMLNEAAKAFGVDPKGGMWQLDPKYVGPYAEWDAWAPVHIWKKQMEEIKRQGLEEVLKLELAIQPILWLMRLRGIPVNVDAARKLAKQYLEKSEHTIASIVADYGTGLPKIDIWSGTSIASYCNINKVYYPRTGKGNPSFTKEFLESSSDKMLKQIRVAREYQRLSSVFIQGWIIDNQIDGYVHPQWKQLATDDGGTRTGRMAAANPNPQQVPKRSAQGKVIRGMFMHSTRKWAKLDYSQQEPRILMHFAYLMNMSGAAEARQMFLDNPDQDFYNMMMELASIERPQAKDLYLGRCYGMGIDKLADKLRCDIAKAGSILQQFDSKVPFIKELSEFTEHKAQQRGYIRTLSGRRRHFNMWEPSNYRNYKGESDLLPVESSEAALAKWPGIQIKRSDTRKALNSLIQGSAADMTKYAMVKIYEETGEYPYMQVHDELNYPCDSMEQAEVFKRMMENCVQLSIPIKADLDWGKAWN